MQLVNAALALVLAPFALASACGTTQAKDAGNVAKPQAGLSQRLSALVGKPFPSERAR
jgi:hypothetical protein